MHYFNLGSRGVDEGDSNWNVGSNMESKFSGIGHPKVSPYNISPSVVDKRKYVQWFPPLTTVTTPVSADLLTFTAKWTCWMPPSILSFKVLKKRFLNVWENVSGSDNTWKKCDVVVSFIAWNKKSSKSSVNHLLPTTEQRSCTLMPLFS